MHNRLFRGFICLLVLLFSGSAFGATCPKCTNETTRLLWKRTENVSNPFRGKFTLERTGYGCPKCGVKFQKSFVPDPVPLPPKPLAIVKTPPLPPAPRPRVTPPGAPATSTRMARTAVAAPRLSIVPAAVPSEFAAHGPPYVQTHYIPYAADFLYADYYLLAGKLYQFETSENLVQWYSVVEPYFAPADEVYARSINISVNGYYYPKQFMRMRIVP